MNPISSGSSGSSVTSCNSSSWTSDILISLLPDVSQLEDALARSPEALGNAHLLIVVASTSSPEAVRRLAAELHDRHAGRIRLIDAPVSGGTDGAEAGTLSIMIGGSVHDAAEAIPVLSLFGTPRHLGPLGAGQIAKACNQLIVASTIFALGEATAVAARAGLDVRAMWELLAQGYAGSRVLTTRLDRLVSEDYSVSGPAKFMVKDLGFAREEARNTQTRTDLLNLLSDEFLQLVDAGFGEHDISVTRAFIESRPFAD